MRIPIINGREMSPGVVWAIHTWSSEALAEDRGVEFCPEALPIGETSGF